MTGTNGSKPAPILDLDDLIEPGAEWIYQKKTYQYVRWSSLGILERRRIANRHERILALESLIEPTEAEVTEYHLAVRELIKLITVDVPDDVLDTMDPEQQSECYTYFLALRLVRMSDLKEKRQRSAINWAESLIQSPTSERPSPDSTDSGPKRTRRSGSESRT